MVQKLIPLLVWLLFIAAVCPGPQYAHSKRGIFKGRGKGDSNKGASSSQSGGGLPKQGVKWAGSAAAGMLGGTGTGYGLGFLGKPNKHVSKSHYHSHKTQDQQHQQQRENQRVNKHSVWRAFVKGEAPASMCSSVCLTIGHVVPFLTAAWIQYI